MNKLKVFYRNYPLYSILAVAFLVRLLAAFFSKGYAFHDDHFDVIRVAQNWVYGLPHWIEAQVPPKHSMIYPALNAGIIWILEAIGINDPIAKTTALRILHSVYSLLIISLGFRITELISHRKNAIRVAWILSLLWFMPYLSVKFLAELVCVPPVLYAFYLILKSKSNSSRERLHYFLAGSLFALAFSVRIHTVLFAGGMGLVLLYEKKWRQSIYFTLAFLLTTSLVIGIPDILFFEYPFQYVVNYFAHNTENAYNYITGSPFKFLLTTFGFLVPPVSVMLMWGYLRTWKVDPKIFMAVLVFFVVHSIFPNKQERFILPMYPLLIILGTIGWSNFVSGSDFWKRFPRVLRGSWLFFWVMNISVGLALALTSSKRDRVGPIYYLSQKTDLISLIVESERSSPKQVPVYYLGKIAADYKDFQKGDVLGMNTMKEEGLHLNNQMPFVFTLGSAKSTDELKVEMASVNRLPNYVIFKGEKGLDQRIERIQLLFPDQQLKLDKIIKPSLFDKVLHKLNPRRHRNQIARVYKIE